jgi:aldose sugar dehydrogenase
MKNFLKLLLLFSCCLSCKKLDETIAPDGSNVKLVVADWQKNLVTPWEISFSPDGRIFFTERQGRVRVVKNGVMETWLDIQGAVEDTESGLLGIAVDPDFINNRFVYIAYTYSTPEWKFVNRLVRCKENSNGKGFEEKILIDNIRGLQNHNGGPIKFGPDGKLYWTVGDSFDGKKAQDLTNLNGKVLRLNSDGTIPSDNPFPNSYIWSYGHRNVQGLSWQEGTNTLFVTEHGPTGDLSITACCNDEINIVEKGKNYGWPKIYGKQTAEGLVSPIYLSGSDKTWAPAGAVFLKKGLWKGSFLFVGLRGVALYRAVINPNNPREILRVEEYLKGTFGRLRDVAEAPDGKIYICVSNRDGRGEPRAEDDRIITLSIENK